MEIPLYVQNRYVEVIVIIIIITIIIAERK